jgi:glycosyltransferase involved in cell wall biosynthesis
MTIAFVVQRYGLEVNGGAELLCRQVAERLAGRYPIEVLTSCAIDYATWRDAYPPGVDRVNGLPVRRFPVDAPRDPARFAEVSRRVFGGRRARDDELAWMRAQGPYSSRFLEHLRAEGARYECAVFFTYLYAFTFFGLPLVRERSVLVPTAHDEPPISLGIFREVFAAPRALIFLTPEEQAFVNARFGTAGVPQAVAGVGVEVPAGVQAGRFLAARADQLEGWPVLLYAGRIDESKGCRQLFSHFVRFREDVPAQPVKLVLLGRPVTEVPDHPDILPLGFVPDRDKFDALAAAAIVVTPSPYESLSLSALEAWRLGRPVLANGACAVLREQCRRSQGGLWYETYAEFREALRRLLADAGLRQALGASGRRYVERRYTWSRVEGEYVRCIERVRGGA